MKTCKEILKKASIYPKLQLARKKQGGGTESTGAHRVKIVADKLAKEFDPETGKEREVVKFLLEEAGERKTYKVPVLNKQGEVHYLIQRFGELREGEEIVLEFKRKGLKGYIDVLRISDSSEVEVGENEELPAIDLNEDVFGDSENEESTSR